MSDGDIIGRVTGRMKRYILWDHDGVLVDTEPLYYEVTKRGAGRSRSRPGTRRLSGGHGGGTHRLATRGRSRRRPAHDRDAEGLAGSALPGVAPRTRDRDPWSRGGLARLAPDYSMAIVTTAKRSDFELIHRNRNIVDQKGFRADPTETTNAPSQHPILP
jgi:hypothetical protein